MRLQLDEASLKRVINRLDKMPNNLRRNALTSAMNAGARVVRDRARAKAPACLIPSIKIKRRKQHNGTQKTSVVAGNSAYSRRDDIRQYYNEAGLKGLKFSKALSASMDCDPAFWTEFGTYGNRDLIKNPYSPETFKRHPAYRRLGRSDSPFWKVRSKWKPARPFLRPALISASTDGSIERAMAKQLEKYMTKKGF